MPKHRKPPEWVECSISGRRLAYADRIGLVQHPDGYLVADVEESLPVKHLWVACDTLAQAVSEGLFEEEVSEALVQDAITALRKRILSFVSLAKKSGDTVLGFEGVREALQSHPASALVIASDASARELERLLSGIKETAPIRYFSRAEISATVGKDGVTYLAVASKRWRQKIIVETQKLGAMVSTR